MKILIASDIHGSFYWAEKLIEAFKREEADRIFLLGDILYHGPRNDLPRDYNPKKVIELLNQYKEKIFAIRGNCDTEVDQMVLKFPILADYSIIPVGKRLIYATHGHVFNTSNIPPIMQGDILLTGHTHVPAWQEFGENNLYINPGSISIPKENSEHSYMILEDKELVWKNLDGIEYHRIGL